MSKEMKIKEISWSAGSRTDRRGSKVKGEGDINSDEIFNPKETVIIGGVVFEVTNVEFTDKITYTLTSVENIYLDRKYIGTVVNEAATEEQVRTARHNASLC